jgi:hypothetical protein
VPNCQRVKPALTRESSYPVPPMHTIWPVTTSERIHHAVVAPVPVAAGEHRPTWEHSLILLRGHSRSSSSTFLPSHTYLTPLCSAPDHPHLLTVAGHYRSSPLPSEQGTRSTIISSLSRTSFKPRADGYHLRPKHFFTRCLYPDEFTVARYNTLIFTRK